MPRNYRIERNAIIQRWYGGYPQAKNPKPHRSWKGAPISPADCLGVPIPVNSPYRIPGCCLIWKYRLNQDGYGYLNLGGKRELAHRIIFIQTRGQIPAGKQVNHLCNRPYCVQPSHLYVGTKQDNKDDSRIFRKEELLHAPWILDWSDNANPDDPLLQRLLESDRYDATEPWEPVEQPAQKPLEEFTCHEHDFAITMFSGNSRICRICETSEYQEKIIDESGISELISELCPISQTVTPILSKIWDSEFVSESHREIRRRAYHRSQRAFWEGSHDLRDCECDYCAQDRKAFREAIQPLLTRGESELINVCNRLEPQIAAVFEENSVDMMEVWAKEMGMTSEQSQALRVHIKDCINSRSAPSLQSELGYLLYAVANFNTWKELLEDRTFRVNMRSHGLFRMRKEDEKQIRRNIWPLANRSSDRIILAWQNESDGLMKPQLETKPELYHAIKSLARALTFKRVLEHLRFELLGRNSFVEQEPHPHSGCAASIIETGRVQSQASEIQEGMGYRPRAEKDNCGHYTVRTTAVDFGT